MERLTDKIDNTNCVKGCGSNCKYGFQYCRKEDWENCQTISDVIDKLAEYEDLEEQGRLIKLPCKVGARLYWIDDEDDYGHKEMCIKQYSESEKVTGFSLGEDGEVLVFIGYDGSEPNMVGERYALLTRESGEAKLKELRGREDGSME